MESMNLLIDSLFQVLVKNTYRKKVAHHFIFLLSRDKKRLKLHLDINQKYKKSHHCMTEGNSSQAQPIKLSNKIFPLHFCSETLHKRRQKMNV